MQQLHFDSLETSMLNTLLGAIYKGKLQMLLFYVKTANGSKTKVSLIVSL